MVPDSDSDSDSESELAFVAGDEVEVCSDQDGFSGAYFAASVVRSLPNLRGYTVSYLSLVSSQSSGTVTGGPLRETLPARLLRPRPPSSSDRSDSQRCWRLHDCVDAFHHDAWWSGVVVAVSVGSPVDVSVCFPLYREVLSFSTALVRLHLEWRSGRWMSPAVLVTDSPLVFRLSPLLHCLFN